MTLKFNKDGSVDRRYNLDAKDRARLAEIRKKQRRNQTIGCLFIVGVICFVLSRPTFPEASADNFVDGKEMVIFCQPNSASILLKQNPDACTQSIELDHGKRVLVSDIVELGGCADWGETEIKYSLIATLDTNILGYINIKYLSTSRGEY